MWSYCIPIRSDELWHSGVPGSKWGVHQQGKWDKRARYAQGKSNPDAKSEQQKISQNTSYSASIWGRDRELTIELGPHLTQSEKSRGVKLLSQFRKSPEWVEDAKPAILEYITNDYNRADTQEPVPSDLNKSLIPQHVLFSRGIPTAAVSYRKQDSVALLCKYKYDIEHGLAVVFDSNGKVVDIGPQDIIL